MPTRELLFLTPVAPARTGGGLAMRAGLFLEGLSRAFDVSVRVVPPQDAVAGASALLATPGGRALLDATHPLPALSRAIDVGDIARFDAVHVMRLYLAPCIADLFERSERPFLSLDLDDDDASLHAQLGLAEEAERFARLAAYAVPRFDLVVDASSIPNAISVPPVLERHDGSGLRLLFVGDLGYAPNIDAAIRLCDEILPALPGATATIVGARPPDLGARPGVEVFGDVESVSPFYASSDVAVVPLAAGSGSRTKILEAFAHRVPVVSTEVGAAGIEELLIAETAEEFAAAILRLRDDAVLRAAIVDAAEDAFRRRFSFDVVADSIASTWLQSFADGRR